jgi:hypothetical protein
VWQEGFVELKNPFDCSLYDELNVQISFQVLMYLSLPFPAKAVKHDIPGKGDRA